MKYRVTQPLQFKKKVYQIGEIIDFSEEKAKHLSFAVEPLKYVEVEVDVKAEKEKAKAEAKAILEAEKKAKAEAEKEKTKEDK